MKNLILVIGAVAVIGALGCGLFYGRPAYRHFKETRGLRQANAFWAAGDLVNASLSARQVLQLNPRNVDACRIIAQLAELAHSPAVIEWRHRIAELEPTVANRLKLASCALRFQRPPYSLAAQTLRDLEPAARDLPAFQIISAEYSLKMNLPKEASAHFEQAAKLEPKNELHQLNLAVLNLQSTNLATVAVARQSLEHLSTNQHLGPLALRWLIVDHLRRDDLSTAEILSSRLLADSRAQWDDCLQHANILQRSTKTCPSAEGTAREALAVPASRPDEFHETALSAGGPAETIPVSSSRTNAFTEYLLALQVDAVTNAADLYATSEWMGSHGLADDAMRWLAGLDPRLREAQPVPLAMANLLMVKADWRALEALLVEQKWVDLEFLRFAFLARAGWGQQQQLTAETRWRSAARAAAERLGPLTLLLSLAAEWGRDPEDLLWQIGRRFPREQWALRELEGRYLAAGNTRGLNTVYASLAGPKLNPADSTNQNNFAATSMLLKVNLAQAHQTARDLYRRTPHDSIIASTYAYSLHLQGRTSEGLAVFGRLKPEALETPAVALYYGLLLAAAGDTGRAARYLTFVQPASLLPEERALMAEARHRL